MTDRELLELAAKACGLEEAKLRIEFNQWNPLADDGDALRLAVKLNLSADFFDDEIKVGYTPNDNECDQVAEAIGDDPNAATRRAITRAAAEIGRRLETIKMETVKEEDGNSKIVWKYNDPTVIAISQSSYEQQSIIYATNNTEWARVDKDLNLVRLDMDLCAKGSANVYTALAVGIWNAALEKAADDFDLGDDYYYDEVRESILRLKK